VTTSLVDIAYGGRNVSIEYRWLHPSARPLAMDARRPLVVFLHEGLGSVAMWRDYPQRFCDEGGYRGLVYSREGYGRSTPRTPDQHWPATFMHEQAIEMLPHLFARLDIGTDGNRPWLFGHSDGASIALIHAATFPDAPAGVIAVAPHIVVEPLSLRSIAAARDAYVEGDLRRRLARYHDDVDSAFHGWNGTLAQVEGIRERAPQTEVVVLPACGHSPQRDAPQALTHAAIDFITRHSTGAD
jgi:pimeloyl-ACP methyl ester carboxylesterase